MHQGLRDALPPALGRRITESDRILWIVVRFATASGLIALRMSQREVWEEGGHPSASICCALMFYGASQEVVRRNHIKIAKPASTCASSFSRGL